MGRQFTDGGEAGDILLFSTSSNLTNTTTNARIGGRCYVITSNGSWTKPLPTPVAEGYFRWAMFFTASNASFKLQFNNAGVELGSLRRNTTSNCMDWYTSTGTLVASGIVPLLASTMYLFELHYKIADSGGIYDLKINGMPETGATYTGDTKPTAATTVDTMVCTCVTGNTHFDDMAFNDVSGSVDNSWCGDGHIYGQVVNGNGDSSQLTGSDGNSTDNYLLVDEIPSNSDTDYVSGATVGFKDLYAVTNLSGIVTGSTISRVIVEARTKELAAESDTIQLGVKSGGTEAWSSDIIIGLTYGRQAAEFLVDPSTSAAWTLANFDSIQAGVKLT